MSKMYNVLLVDDDIAVRYILKRFDWKKYNFVVTNEAGNGKEALSILEKHHIDLIITDIRMPGINGIELLEELQERAGYIPQVILLSTYNDFEYAQSGIRYGALDYLTKPVKEEELITALHRCADVLKKTLTELMHSKTCVTEDKDGTDNKKLKIKAMNSLPEYFAHTDNPSNLILNICMFVVKNLITNPNGISLENVSDSLGMSRDYVGRLFKKNTGLNFLDYTTQLKMEYAKNLLSEGKYKNYEISELLGYRTPDYFSQLFKKHVGITPLEYRSSIKKL